MEVGIKTIGDANIQFFGKMVASLSHEIKNVFAIIHENAGLLEDLVLLGEKGRPLDPLRVKGLAVRMRDQILRGNEIVQNMNRFAHSADVPIEDIDLTQTLVLLINLFKRSAAMKGITLESPVPGGSVTVRTNPFLFENLMWLCVSEAMDCVTESKKMMLAAENTEEGARIRFSGLDVMQGTVDANIAKG
jgi:signal transduction histidine kinase